MKEKILIIEDESSLLDSLTKELGTKYYVIDAVTGDVGLSKALETKPDLIILDLLLPMMSGEDIMSALRKDLWGKDAKVIVLTNLDNPNIEAKMIRLGALEYFIKSNISMAELSSIVLKHLHPEKPVYFNIAK